MGVVLKKIPFTPDLLPAVLGFDCAEHTPAKIWEEEINDWIRADPKTKEGAIYRVKKGTQVWLYANEEDDVVGYSSLGKSKWPDPNVLEKVPDLPSVPISLIPAVGIDNRFHGGPVGAGRQEKYSSQIINHLISEARKHLDRQPFLGLLVHPENEKAIGLYRRMHFENFENKTYYHDVAGVYYQGMVLKLDRTDLEAGSA